MRRPGAHCNLGAALQEFGHFGEAVANHKKALAIRPDYAEAYYNLGTAYQDLDRLADAIAGYEKALELKPSIMAGRTAIYSISTPRCEIFLPSRNSNWRESGNTLRSMNAHAMSSTTGSLV